MTDSPLRILHVVLASEPGGLSRYVIDITVAMRRLGHDVVVAGDRGAAHGLFESAGVPYIEIPLKAGLVGFFKSANRLRRHLQQHPAQVLHTHYRRATLLARRMQVRPRGVFTSSLPGAEDSIVPLDPTPFPPILYTLHLSHINIRGHRRWLTDFGDHTHAASADAHRWLIDSARLKPERITLIPHGVDPARFAFADEHAKREAKAAIGIDPGALVAAYVGRFEYPKNEQWVLDLACATRDRSDLHFLLVGGGPDEPDLRHRIDSENLHERVHLFGHQDDVSSFYRAADLLLLPSAREGFSLVCAEAMGVGVPVLRTRTSGVAELIVEDVTGRSVPIDHDAFIDAAVAMLRDRPSLQRMGLAATKHVHDNFTFERQVAQTLELYRRLIDSSPKAPSPPTEPAREPA